MRLAAASPLFEKLDGLLIGLRVLSRDNSGESPQWVEMVPRGHLGGLHAAVMDDAPAQSSRRWALERRARQERERRSVNDSDVMGRHRAWGSYAGSCARKR